MNELLYIIWNLNPEMFSIPFLDRAPRWYGLLFASGFIFGQIIVTWIYTKENKDPTTGSDNEKYHCKNRDYIAYPFKTLPTDPEDP